MLFLIVKESISFLTCPNNGIIIRATISILLVSGNRSETEVSRVESDCTLFGRYAGQTYVCLVMCFVIS